MTLTTVRGRNLLFQFRRTSPAGMHTGCKTDTVFNSETPETCCTSIACGLDLEEKRAQLKSAMKQRREMLRERRQRC
ncbi:hypothetical protein AHF37_06106 [Paragonimus kellicotti]|nr:hypothetical protein AHF37_06106 [Paragonimus kellicotti]